MIQPALQDDAFLADVAAVDPAADDFSLWWLGQSGFLIQWKGHRILLDPYLSDSLTEKYAATDKPHVRMTARVVDPARLSGIDAVTASHIHTDHLDPQTLQPLCRANPAIRLICPESIRAGARTRSGLPDNRIAGLDFPVAAPPAPLISPGVMVPESTSVGPFEIHAVPAAHERLDRDAEGRLIALGFLVRFGPWTVYHSGDTMLFSGMEELLRKQSIDLALLPINGRTPERRVAGNLWGREAAGLAHAIGARWVIPCHYDQFEFNTATPDEFVSACRELGQSFSVLQAGARWTPGGG